MMYTVYHFNNITDVYFLPGNKMISGIYQIRNILNNKIYIGSAVNIQRRFQSHKSTLNLKKHHNRHLQAAWNLDKEANFRFEILEKVLDKEKLLKREQYYLDLYESYTSKIGYNHNPIAGSSLNRKISVESRQKMSKAKKGLSTWWLKGIPKTKEHVEKIRLRKLGTILSEETKEKISCANSFSMVGNTNCVGRKLSAQHKAKLNHLGQKMSYFTKQKISKTKKGCTPWNKGISYSEKSRQKQRLTWLVKRFFKYVGGELI